MAFRLVTCASRRLRSTICAQFIPREARTNGNRLGYKYKWAETEFISESEAKPDFLRYNREFGMFGAYLFEDDGSITRSPKYNKYLPSFKMELEEDEDPFLFWTSCDGLIYLRYPKGKHVLWNPTTHEYKILPEPYAHPSRCLSYLVVASGMWHDHTSQDYIVVNLVRTYMLLGTKTDSSHFIHLYSLKTNSWKIIPCPCPHCFGFGTTCVCLSGILYFTAIRAIRSFDISTQTFSNIPLPKGCRSYHEPHILEYKGLLSVVYSKDAACHVLREYQLWAMHDGLWTRESVFHTRGVRKPLWFSKDGKLLYFLSRTRDMVVFDCATGKSKHLGVDSPSDFDTGMIPFVENFVQLNGISCIEESRNNIKSEVNPACSSSSSSTPIFCSLKDGMAFRLVTSATRQLPLCNRVRSAISFSGSRAQLAPRVEVNTRIEGAPPMRNNGNELGRENGPIVSETTLSSCDIFPKPKPKPKPDIFVNYRDSYHYVFTGASCNGVLHFHDGDFHRRGSVGQALWNPTTGGYKILPKSSVELRPHSSHEFDINGVWSDHRFEDYKVLNIVRANERGGRLPEDVSYYIDLYSLKLNSWRRIPCPDFKYCGYESVCVAGVFYCRASLNKTGVILSFDFNTETLSTLSLPNKNCNRHYFLDYKGLLSVLACWWDEDLDDEIPWKYELWIRSAGSWTRESIFHVHGVSKPLWFSQDGKLLYFASVDDELVMFDRSTGKLNHLGVDCWMSKVIPFFESFVQLN
ncbi:uncharacterized protein LOC125223995 isoform X2 [Salvia hispanica]|uniref:uncharacterized protein LOC125223995 isoform X2 n=1 Tax=Salvia hispanica TaxID=49212 RepID=UPI0020095105|nr:uncharacterized protein LOC125223995 isoform X2 [Salvia hispanica]